MFPVTYFSPLLMFCTRNYCKSYISASESCFFSQCAPLECPSGILTLQTSDIMELKLIKKCLFEHGHVKSSLVLPALLFTLNDSAESSGKCQCSLFFGMLWWLMGCCTSNLCHFRQFLFYFLVSCAFIYCLWEKKNRLSAGYSIRWSKTQMWKPWKSCRLGVTGGSTSNIYS